MPKNGAGTTEVHRLSDLTADPQNANLGTAQGREALARSLRDYGAARSVVIDRKASLICSPERVYICGT